jgi:steroid 5-alpha reductase family enzyme
MGELAVIWAAAGLLMAGLWLVQRRRNDASLVDAGWAAGIGAAALALALAGDGDGRRRAVLAVMSACWSLRLSVHLLRDRVLGKPEDGRYAMLRAGWGAHAQRNFFWFFQAQAALVVVFALPAWVVAGNARAFGGWWDGAGVALWALGLGIEIAADRTLARWRQDPANRGRTCRAGWWRWSRHPNYFGEWLLWWGYAALALGSATVLVAVAVPLLLLGLLLGVTGIPYTERRALACRGDDYRRYQQATSAFIPWFPRAESP